MASVTPSSPSGARSVVFIQRSRLGRAFFDLRGDTLHIEVRSLGRKDTAVFPLRRIHTEYTLFRRRLHALYLIPLCVAAASIGIALWIVRSPYIPDGLAQWPASVALFALPAAVCGFPRFYFFVFQDPWKRPLFTIIRESSQAAECDAFVEELLVRVHRLEADLPAEDMPAEKPRPLSVIPLPKAEPVLSMGPEEHRWKFSLGFGFVGAVIPFVASLVPALEMMALPLVIGCSIGASTLAVLSFSAKERLRYVGVVGVALSLLPAALG